MQASDIPCYAIYTEDFHHSDEWANQLVSLWIAQRQAVVRKHISPKQFRDGLIDGIIELSDWRSAFNQAAREVGADPDDDALFDEYVTIHRNNAFDLIPRALHAEFAWVPEWSGENLDDLIESHGLRSDRWKSCSIGHVQPGNWLAVFLRMVNQSSRELVRAAITNRGTDGEAFANKCDQADFVVLHDQTRPSLLSGEEVITAIENASTLAVPMFHCEVNVRALFEADPSKDLQLSSAKRKIHVGFHEFINGTGYMDTYPGQIVIPASAAGFLGEARMGYGINKTYWIVKSCFYTTPIEVEPSNKEQ